MMRETQFKLPPPRPVRILVIGELVLDRYLWGEVERISPEAPIPILRVTQREERPGNAAFVCANLSAFGAQAIPLSVVGCDPAGSLLVEMMVHMGVEVGGLVQDSGRPTIVKERMLGSVQSANRAMQQLLRVDNEDSRPLSPATERELLGRLQVHLENADGVLVCDINKGLLTPAVIHAIIDGARVRNIPVVIDPRLMDDYGIYRGATAITPNRYETERATGVRLRDLKDCDRAARTLIKRLDLRACLITLDRDGMYLGERGRPGQHIATVPREVYDVTGAGDVVLAVFGLLLTAKEDLVVAAQMANIAAGIEVSRVGAEVVSREDLNRALLGPSDPSQRKILVGSELTTAIARERRAGRRIVFTNGCFDLLHAGHLHLLSFARNKGDVLVVGLNSDRSVRMLKGPERPIYHQSDRAALLAALEMVHYVVIFDELNAERVIREIKPDVLVKGEDWSTGEIDGQSFLQEYGGQIAFAPLLDGRSTTDTIRRLGAIAPSSNAIDSAD